MIELVAIHLPANRVNSSISKLCLMLLPVGNVLTEAYFSSADMPSILISAAHAYALSIFKSSLRASACADMRQETQCSTPLWGNAHHEQLIQQGQLCFLESICSVIGNHLSLSITAPIGAPIVFSSQSLLYSYICIGQLGFALLTFFSTFCLQSEFTRGRV